VSLRAEVIDDDRDGLRAKPWREAVWDWREKMEESKETAVVLENDQGDQVRAGDPSRFHQGYADKQYAKLKDLERGIKADYGRRLHTAMLTLTASSAPGDGPLPPVDHLDELLSSWSAVSRELRRSMEGKRYERLAILEPHESGYLHVHIAVFVEGVVTRADFAPVIEAHLRNCDLAGEQAHDVTDDSTISVRWAGSDRDTEDSDHLDELAIYLAEYLGTYGEEATEQPEHVQMANTVLWATGRQRWRPSNGAQEYMTTNRKPPDPSWEVVGIEDGHGELHEIEGGGGGVTKLETFIPDRSDPPPERWGGLHGDKRHQ
jgi:hypothetical protein